MKTSRKAMLILAMLILATVAAACGGGGGGGDAAGVAESVLSDIFDGDLDGLRGSICDSQASVVDALEEEGIMELMELVEVDLGGANFEVVNETDDTATVRVTGEITMSALGEEQTMTIDELLGGENEVQLVKEGDDWKFCDEGTLMGVGG